MIWNIIDRRTRPYRWTKVHVIAESTAHDNSVTDADQVAPEDDQLIYEEEFGFSVAEAIAWANS